MLLRNYQENETCSYARVTWQQDLIGSNLCLLQIHLVHLVSQLTEGSAHSEAPHTFLLLIHYNLHRNHPQIHLEEEKKLQVKCSSKNKWSIEINCISSHRDDWVNSSLLKATLSHLFIWKPFMFCFIFRQFIVNCIIQKMTEHITVSIMLFCQSITNILVLYANQNTIEVESQSTVIPRWHFKVDTFYIAWIQ